MRPLKIVERPPVCVPGGPATAVVVLSCFGDLTTFSGGRLRSAVLRVIHSEAAGTVLNLRGVSRIDVGGLGGIYRCVSAAHNAYRALAIVLPRSRVEGLITVRLLTVGVPAVASEEEAVEAICRGVSASADAGRYVDVRAA